MENLTATLKIWLYPDNPMSILTLIMFFGIGSLFVYSCIKHNFLSLVVQEFRSAEHEDEERSKQADYIQEKNTDIIHSIGSCLAFVENPENLFGLRTDTGVDAIEVYTFMHNFFVSGRDFINEYSKQSEVKSYRIIGGEIIATDRGDLLVKTNYGNFNSNVQEIAEFVNNPYKFEAIAFKLNLI